VIEGRYVTIVEALRALSDSDQRALAVALAELATPFSRLGQDGAIPPDLVRAIDLVSVDGDLQTSDLARHALIQRPDMAGPEEPSGRGWYVHRACVAWIYAADALTTAPGDGVRNAFLTLDDLLDQAASDLHEPSLVDNLHQCLAQGSSALTSLRAAIEDQAKRLSSK
jgi:hypothetical protein